MRNRRTKELPCIFVAVFAFAKKLKNTIFIRKIRSTVFGRGLTKNNSEKRKKAKYRSLHFNYWNICRRRVSSFRICHRSRHHHHHHQRRSATATKWSIKWTQNRNEKTKKGKFKCRTDSIIDLSVGMGAWAWGIPNVENYKMQHRQSMRL